jgi:3-dehydroquinate synthase
MRKNSTLVCIGGGITQDIAGFISSVLYRGVEWVFIPTTLLAQADSCIGGKTSINLNGIKNQVGSFHPPKKVLVCSKFLETLPSEDIVSGVGESMHYLMVSDDKAEVWRAIESIKSDTLDIRGLIHKCLTIKKDFIEADEFDQGERLILNYGHTFGHALEAQSDISHGRAVAFGMTVANAISELTGRLEAGELDWVNSFFKRFYTEIEHVNVEEYLAALMKDKKNVDDQLTCVLTSGIGKMSLCKISYETVVLALNQLGLVEDYES